MKRLLNRLMFSLLWLLPSLFSLLDQNNLLLKVLLSTYYLLVPGLLVACLLYGNNTKRREPIFFIRIIGLSLAFLMLVGYLANELLPLFAISRPLDKVPLLIMFNVVLYCLAIASYSGLHLKRATSWLVNNRSKLKFGAYDIGLLVAGVMFIALIILGTTALNNGGQNYITIASLVLMACTTIFCFAAYKRFSNLTLLIFIYLASLGLLLMYSLRSQHILGFDVTNEYHVFRLAQSNGKWQLSKYPNPYNACLSITILPTLLSNLLHISGQYIFKFFYQALFALVPVVMYIIYNKLISRSVALVGVFIFIFQLYYTQQLPALTRQEIAFIFLILILECLLVSLKGRLTTSLLFIFSFALIVSHYSTAYFWMFTLISFFLIKKIIQLRFGSKIQLKRGPSPFYLLVFVLGVILWFGQLTATGSNLTQFVTNLPSSFSTLLTGDNLSNDVTKLQLENTNVNTQSNLDSAFKQKTKQINKLSNNFYDTNSKNYQPHLRYSKDLTGILSGLVASVALFILAIVYVLLTYGLEAIGLMTVVVKQKHHKSLLILELLTISCIPLVALIVAVPTIAQQYNLSRAYMQLLILFAPFAALGLISVCKLLRLPKPHFLTGCLLALFLVFTSGLGYLLFGGPAYVTLENYGYDYDKFYISNSEVTAANWLRDHYQSHVPVYTDEYGQLKLQAYTNITHYRSVLFANLVDKNSYVYLDNTNINKSIAFTSYGSQEIEYYVPTTALQSNKNTIYTTGNVDILR